MEEGLILTNEQVIYIINCVPDWEYTSYVGNTKIGIFNSLIDAKFYLSFDDIYDIRMPELMEQITNRIYEYGEHWGQSEKANQIKKALNIEIY